MAYDPRTTTGIPTEPVGSLPRPSKLQAAYADYDAGKISQDELEAEQDAAVEGLDRERARPPARRSSPTASSAGRASRPTRSPTRSREPASRTTSPDGGQYFAIFADGHHRQLPRLTGGPFKYKTYAADTLKKSIKYATQADEAGRDRARRCSRCSTRSRTRCRATRASSSRKTSRTRREKDIRQAFDAGAERVSIDFTEGRLATRNDPAQPVDRRRDAARTSSTSTTGCSTASRPRSA